MTRYCTCSETLDHRSNATATRQTPSEHRQAGHSPVLLPPMGLSLLHRPARGGELCSPAAEQTPCQRNMHRWHFTAQVAGLHVLPVVSKQRRRASAQPSQQADTHAVRRAFYGVSEDICCSIQYRMQPLWQLTAPSGLESVGPGLQRAVLHCCRSPHCGLGLSTRDSSSTNSSMCISTCTQEEDQPSAHLQMHILCCLWHRNDGICTLKAQLTAMQEPAHIPAREA